VAAVQHVDDGDDRGRFLDDNPHLTARHADNLTDMMRTLNMSILRLSKEVSALTLVQRDIAALQRAQLEAAAKRRARRKRAA